MSRLLPIAVLVVACIEVRAEAPKSVLGMEPGETRLCNDDLGIILWGPDAAPTLSVGKSDVWDRRNPVPKEPVLTMARMVEMARTGDRSILNGAAYYTAYNSYDFPCPKPVGQLILQMPFVKANGGTIAIDRQGNRAIHLRAATGGKSVDLRLFVSSIRNLIVISGTAAGLDSGDLAVRVFRHRDTIAPGDVLNPTLGERCSPKDFQPLPMPQAGTTANGVWVAQDFTADATFPKGFTAVLAAQVMGANIHTDSAIGRPDLGTPMLAEKEGRIHHGLYKRYTPINRSPGSAATARIETISGPLLILATATTTQDDPDPLARARHDLAEAVLLGEPALWAEHIRQLDAYDARPHAKAWSADGRLKIDASWGGVPYRVRPAGYYGDVPLCSVDSTKFCYQDSSIWHADFHFNEVEATIPCTLRQYDMLESYYRMIHTMLPMAMANARQVYDCPGAMYSLMHYPLKADTVIHSHITWEQSMEITALLAKPFWLRFQYTWDMAFLRDLAYPVLREGARFYAAYLKPEVDGLYHVFPTVSPEHRGITQALAFNRDSQSGITLIRYHLRAAASAAALLKVDGDEALKWKQIADRMPPYPTVGTPEGPIFIDVAGAQPMEYNIAVPLTAVFWGDDIGLDSPPDQVELAKRTLKKINVWPPHRGYLIGVRRRLGIYDPADGMGVDNVIQSHTGLIRVFPTVPADFEGGFENLGAQGGFVVGAERAKEGVRSVTIQSLAGNECVLSNPWRTGAVRVVDRQSGQTTPATATDATVRFPTNRGRTYVLKSSAP